MTRGEVMRANSRKKEHLMAVQALATMPEFTNIERGLMDCAMFCAGELEDLGSPESAAMLRRAVHDYREAKGVR